MNELASDYASQFGWLGNLIVAIAVVQNLAMIIGYLGTGMRERLLDSVRARLIPAGCIVALIVYGMGLLICVWQEEALLADAPADVLDAVRTGFYLRLGVVAISCLALAATTLELLIRTHHVGRPGRDGG